MDNGDKASFSDSSYTGTRGFRVYDMHSLTYNDKKNNIHAHFGLTDFTKDGYTYTSSSKVTAANDFNGPGSRSFYPSKTMDLDINKRWKIDRHTLLFGSAFNEEQFHQTISGINDWKNWHDSGTPTEWHGGKSQTWSAYVQDKWQLTDRLTSYLGARYDYYKNTADTIEMLINQKIIKPMVPPPTAEYPLSWLLTMPTTAPPTSIPPTGSLSIRPCCIRFIEWRLPFHTGRTSGLSLPTPD